METRWFPTFGETLDYYSAAFNYTIHECGNRLFIGEERRSSPFIFVSILTGLEEDATYMVKLAAVNEEGSTAVEFNAETLTAGK